jgi:hypothetical protein
MARILDGGGIPGALFGLISTAHLNLSAEGEKVNGRGYLIAAKWDAAYDFSLDQE